MFYFVVLKQKKQCFLQRTFVLKQAHITIGAYMKSDILVFLQLLIHVIAAGLKLLCVWSCVWSWYRRRLVVTASDSRKPSKFIVWSHATRTSGRCLTERRWNSAWTKLSYSPWDPKTSMLYDPLLILGIEILSFSVIIMRWVPNFSSLFGCISRVHWSFYTWSFVCLVSWYEALGHFNFWLSRSAICWAKP